MSLIYHYCRQKGPNSSMCVDKSVDTLKDLKNIELTRFFSVLACNKINLQRFGGSAMRMRQNCNANPKSPASIGRLSTLQSLRFLALSVIISGIG